ncbi:MAG: potassium transporter TrkA [Campylobacterota bacterium]|nr:potassium transporter TrkA [Campylobacterota bacterium]
MKNVLVILDGQLAKSLVKRMVSLNSNLNQYDIVYYDDKIIPDIVPENFTFYKFDPTSYSKLLFIFKKSLYQDALVVLNTKEDTQAVIKNIRMNDKNINFTVYDQWGIKSDDNNIKFYKGFDILSNSLVEQLPNIPVFAQNIGLKKGEIMEIKIPFGSNYAYRYIGSIAQKDWKIIILYRNGQLMNIKPSLILKPNDVIIAAGKPEVLTQVYAAISKSKMQFPKPFGSNIYLYIDLFIQTQKEVLNALIDAKILHQRLKNTMLVIKITRPTNIDILNKIESVIHNVDNVKIDIDYHNLGIKNILKTDKKRFDIGVIILTSSLLKYKEAIKNIVSLKLPIFKVGTENISSLKNAMVLLNDDKIYEQISPVLFDVSTQLKINIKIFDVDPIGDTNREELIAHLNNLSKIFNQNINVIEDNSNPIQKIKKEHNILQVLPLREDMFNNRRIQFLTTDSDLLSFDIDKFNQLLIPVIEDIS